MWFQSWIWPSHSALLKKSIYLHRPPLRKRICKAYARTLQTKNKVNNYYSLYYDFRSMRVWYLQSLERWFLCVCCHNNDIRKTRESSAGGTLLLRSWKNFLGSCVWRAIFTQERGRCLWVSVCNSFNTFMALIQVQYRKKIIFSFYASGFMSYYTKI